MKGYVFSFVLRLGFLCFNICLKLVGGHVKDFFAHRELEVGFSFVCYLFIGFLL